MCNLTLLSNVIEGNLSEMNATLLLTSEMNDELANCFLTCTEIECNCETGHCCELKCNNCKTKYCYGQRLLPTECTVQKTDYPHTHSPNCTTCTILVHVHCEGNEFNGCTCPSSTMPTSPTMGSPITMGTPTMNSHSLTKISSPATPSFHGNLLPMTTPSSNGNLIIPTSSPVANGNQDLPLLVMSGILFGVSILLVIGVSITCIIVIIQMSRKSKNA